jgi:transcriptional regulator with XRE-family HTH domain
MAARGRPPKPLDRDSSSAAYLGAELRARRQQRGLTQQDLAVLIGFSPQHVSEVERAKAAPTHPFVAACDRTLSAQGRLLELLPAVSRERALQRDQRTAARRAEQAALPSRAAPYGEAAGEDDVEPTDRRGLLGAGAAAALGVAGISAAPAAARAVDPELPEHWTQLLNLLGRHDEVLGPRDVLVTVEHQLGMMGQYRQAARGALRTEMMRVESRWSDFASWLSHDSGRRRHRDVWTDRALRLAREADYPDMMALVNRRLSEWAVQEREVPRAVAFAETGRCVRGTSAQTRSLCARQAALGHALAGDGVACERRLAEAYSLVEDDDSPAPLWAGEFRCTTTSVRQAEARCRLFMRPRDAIALYDDVLREWPRDLTRDRGVHQARLALACAAANERDRAEAEGRKALACARATKSATAAQELRRLGTLLSAA